MLGSEEGADPGLDAMDTGTGGVEHKEGVGEWPGRNVEMWVILFPNAFGIYSTHLIKSLKILCMCNT